MSHARDDSGWLKRGRQRAAVARVLRKPMTATEICAAARAINPHVQLRDIWFLLRQMQDRNLAVCLNPRLVTGRLFMLSPKGQTAVQEAFATQIAPLPTNIDWRKYSWVIRAKIRRLTLAGLGHLEQKTAQPQTATNLRKHLRPERPVGLNPVIRALKDLARLGLVQCAGTTEKRRCKLYRLAPAGKRILEQLNR
jgi:Fe2+ or Zn2+ uptake regulation protein